MAGIQGLLDGVLEQPRRRRFGLRRIAPATLERRREALSPEREKPPPYQIAFA